MKRILLILLASCSGEFPTGVQPAPPPVVPGVPDPVDPSPPVVTPPVTPPPVVVVPPPVPPVVPPVPPVVPPLPPIVRPPNAITGLLKAIDGPDYDLSKDNDKPTILVFVSESCKYCVAEAYAIRMSLKNPSVPPNKINLVTALIYGDRRDAVTWRDDNKISWPMTYDPNGVLFKKYCGNSVPCIVVNTPKRGIVLKHSGVVPISTLKSYSGEWE